MTTPRAPITIDADDLMAAAKALDKPARTRPRERPASKARAATRTAGKPWPPKVRDEAVEYMREHGVAATHQRTGIPKATLSVWARKHGVDLGEQARTRTAKANAAVITKHAEARLTTAELLERIVEQSAMYLDTIARVNHDAAHLIAAVPAEQLVEAQSLAGPYVVIQDPEAAAAKRRAMALDGLPLAVRDAVGALTRGIHDLQLLTGQATERGELVVDFAGAPRPSRADLDVDVIDVDVIED